MYLKSFEALPPEPEDGFGYSRIKIVRSYPSSRTYYHMTFSGDQIPIQGFEWIDEETIITCYTKEEHDDKIRIYKAMIDAFTL